MSRRSLMLAAAALVVTACGGAPSSRRAVKSAPASIACSHQHHGNQPTNAVQLNGPGSTLVPTAERA